MTTVNDRVLKFSHNGVRIIIEFGFAGQPEWIRRLESLGRFLATLSAGSDELTIYTFEDQSIGGLRIAEVSWATATESGGVSGASIMRADFDTLAVIMLFEKFCSDVDVDPSHLESIKLEIERLLSPPSAVREGD